MFQPVGLTEKEREKKMVLVEKSARQGDVWVEATGMEVEAFERLEKIEPDPIVGCVLAEGEVTGHHHAFRPGDGDVELRRSGDKMFAYVRRDGATLTHDEHGPISFKRGVYEVIRQQEKTPSGWEQVAD
jgi:hypothetical protein